MRIRPARKRLLVARLLEHFHCRLEDLATKTDRQIMSLWLHYRDQEGRIVLSDEEKQAEKPATLETGLADLNMLRYLIEMTDEDYDRLKGDLEKKYAGV